MKKPETLKELKRSAYRPCGVKEELRSNLLRKLRAGESIFPGIIGYDRTVIPQVQNAILSRHDFILLGLRGQAKTRLLRALTSLLDEEVPVVDGCEINDDPLAPICAACQRRLAEVGDALPISWWPRQRRYQEKLATPDVTIADLIGDIDPIKAATRKLSFADPEVIHYGIIPRTNRGIFAINELPDLQARIQVGLFNILEEGDVQIRGFPIRMPLDILLVFSANPEDYTNRGSIITPLRDRIASQILTHYPRTLDEALAITDQEAWREREGGVKVEVPPYLRLAIEEVAFQARQSDFVDQNSGVSARLGIALLENVISSAERRGCLSGEKRSVARVSDLITALPAVTGKVELVYEGEREGAQKVALHLLGKAVKRVFEERFPDAYRLEEEEAAKASIYAPVLGHFRRGETVDVGDDVPSAELARRLGAVPGLEELTRQFLPSSGPAESAAAMEFVLEGLHQCSLLAKEEVVGGRVYKDLFDEMVKDLS
jgi:magnesium chelatase subunit I